MAVLDMHSHTFDFGIETGAFGHRPTLHRSVKFQSKVVMKMAGPVLLNHEGQRVSPRYTAVRRLGGDREVAFGFVSRQRVMGHN